MGIVINKYREMSIRHQDAKLAFMGNHFTSQWGWNKELCFEARDTLHACVDAQENGNKYRCPDELYAYEMWCPNDFRRKHSHLKRIAGIESEMYDVEWVNKVNSEKQYNNTGHWVVE